MATKSFSSSSVKILNNHQSLQKFYEIKVIAAMKTYDQSVKINHNPNWLYVPDNPYRILIIGGSGSGKTNVLSNLIKQQ